MYICTYHTVIENYLDKCKKKFIRLTFFGSFNNSLFMKSENECQRFNSPQMDDNIYEMSSSLSGKQMLLLM